ncbi:MAG TPA: PAS domain S-box protein [Verrucomicrobiota bacterium]|nr:PAS domain S-box protein [Verrucomicrobiota bacterium]HNU50705.1 PAS domain S-box protein [Verrucomicrobiota bacterium]
MTPDEANLRSEFEAVLRFETLLVELSSKFIILSAERIGQAINDALGDVCGQLGLDGIALWEAGDLTWETMMLTHSHRPAEEPDIPLRIGAAEEFPWRLSELQGGRTIVIASITSDVPAHAALDREGFRRHGMKSVLDIPLASDPDPPFGVITFFTRHRERIWPAFLVEQSRLLAQIIANALMKQRADLALQPSEERAVLAAETAGIGLWTLKAGETRFWTAANLPPMLGLPPADGLELDRFLSLVHPDDRALVQAAVESALQRDAMQVIEYRVVRPDGTTRWLTSRGRRRVGRDGLPLSIAGTTTDITERKLVALELERERALLEAVFDSVPGLIYLWSAEGALVRWNRQHETITGYSAEELKGLRVETYFQGENLVRMRREWERVFTEGRSRGMFDCTLKDGRTVPFLLTGVRLEIDGRPHLVGMGLDISEQRAAEAQLTDMTLQLQRATRVAALGELSGAIAHELRQPLAGILSTAQAGELLIKGDACSCSEMLVMLGEIVADTKRADSIIRGLQDVYRKQDASFGTLEVQTLLQDALHEAEKDRILAQAPAPKPCASLGAVAVRGSRVQLLRVVANLLQNAAQATAGMADRERQISVGAETSAGSVRIWVQDNGPGIDPAKIDSIFEPLVTWRSGGMGLGLAISRKIVETHGGTTWAENVPGGGARVGFSLPVMPWVEGSERG